MDDALTRSKRLLWAHELRESHFKSPGTTKTGKAGDAIDVAARYFVYKLYEATEGQPGQ